MEVGDFFRFIGFVGLFEEEGESADGFGEFFDFFVANERAEAWGIGL